MFVRIESAHMDNSQILKTLRKIKEFEFVVPVRKALALETDIDKAIKKGLQSKMTEEKDFLKSFKKHLSKWQKHFSE